jgi:tetratricopeptide (TPR) repeat protein
MMKISNRSRGHIDYGLKKGKGEACSRQTTFHPAAGDSCPSLLVQKGGSVMKKILFMVILSVSLMACLTSPAWAGGLDDANIGMAALRQQNYDEAIRLFTNAIASGELSQKQLSSVYPLRGLAWSNKKDYDKAIADYTKGIEINPQSAEAYGGRGDAWYGKGDYAKAIADYTKAIEINPKDAGSYHNRGLAWYVKKDYDKAIADFTKAIEINPKDAGSYHNRGLAWQGKGDGVKAIEDYAKAKELGYK